MDAQGIPTRPQILTFGTLSFTAFGGVRRANVRSPVPPGTVPGSVWARVRSDAAGRTALHTLTAPTCGDFLPNGRIFATLAATHTAHEAVLTPSCPRGPGGGSRGGRLPGPPTAPLRPPPIDPRRHSCQRRCHALTEPVLRVSLDSYHCPPQPNRHRPPPPLSSTPLSSPPPHPEAPWGQLLDLAADLGYRPGVPSMIPPMRAIGKTIV